MLPLLFQLGVWGFFNLGVLSDILIFKLLFQNSALQGLEGQERDRILSHSLNPLFPAI